MTSIKERMKQRMGKPMMVMTKRDKQSGAVKHGTIQLLPDGQFQQRYDIGEKVMDSCHNAMEIRHAVRNADNFNVVIKIRYKPHCFANRAEEREWRVSTEFMLNMPPCDGVAQLFEVCEDNKAYYIVTELAKGMDLFELLHQQKKFTVDAAREIMKPLLEAVAHMHENSAVHKDLKLENVVVDAGAGEIRSKEWSPRAVKIIDFDTVEEVTPKSPRAKDVLGTDQYIAQEAYDGNYTSCSDVFACGVILYRLAAGRYPFREEIFDDKPGENYVGSPKMQQIRGRLKMAQISWKEECFSNDKYLTELCQRMLAYDENSRPSARDALMSPFFGGPGMPKTQSPVCSPRSKSPPPQPGDIKNAPID